MLQSNTATFGAIQEPPYIIRKDSFTSMNAMPDLEENLAKWDLSLYVQLFRDEGFDTWNTLMDITESDLDALGVKLGHRRVCAQFIFVVGNYHSTYLGMMV